jgi:Phosphotransferase enzyme family
VFPTASRVGSALSDLGLLASAAEGCDTLFLDAAVRFGPTHGAPSTVTVRSYAQRLRFIRRRPSGGRRVYIEQRGPNGPQMLIDINPLVRQYVATVMSRPTARIGKLRNRLIASRLGSFLGTIQVGHETADAVIPWPLRAAADAIGLEYPAAWLVQLRSGDDGQRMVFHAFGPGESQPTWVLKMSRLPGGPARSTVERNALDALQRYGPAVTDRATVVLGELQLNGAQASVERAAPGTTMSAWISTEGMSAVPMIHSVLAWIDALAAVPGEPHDDGTVEQLRQDTLVWYNAEDLAPRLIGLPSVVAHNDVGTWNILTDGRQFTVVDWEGANPAGWPMWDGAYFLTDALAELCGPSDHALRPRWACDLWAGGLEQSPWVLDWLKRSAISLGIERSRLSAAIVAGWLHHGRSRGRRAAIFGGDAGGGWLGDIAAEWLRDPRLGLQWDAA